MSKYGLLNFLRIADSYVNADVTTFDGLERSLKAWFAFEYKTTLEDPRLLDMTLEDLIVLRQMHRVKNEPDILKKTVIPELDAYEAWLKKEMGESYVSEEEMADGMVQYDKESAEKRLQQNEKLPDKIVTDFSDLAQWENE